MSPKLTVLYVSSTSTKAWTVCCFDAPQESNPRPAVHNVITLPLRVETDWKIKHVSAIHLPHL